MQFGQYLTAMQKIEEILVDFLDTERSEEKDSLILNFNYFEGLNSEAKKYRLKEILHLISLIANNHHRSYNFFQKICTILIHFKDDIKQNFSNYEIFKVFCKNKRILSFLFKEQIINFDQQFIDLLKDESYQFYFIPEIASTFNDNSEKQELFESNREKGENESMICQIIRKDSVEEFNAFINKENLNLSEVKIQPSIFETNEFLMDKQPSLMEYAAFFGSIRIIQYLHAQKIKLSSSLWIYAVHANSQELIRYLEKKSNQTGR